MLIDRKEAPARLLIAAEDKRSGSLRSAAGAGAGRAAAADMVCIVPSTARTPVASKTVRRCCNIKTPIAPTQASSPGGFNAQCWRCSQFRISFMDPGFPRLFRPDCAVLTRSCAGRSTRVAHRQSGPCDASLRIIESPLFFRTHELQPVGADLHTALDRPAPACACRFPVAPAVRAWAHTATNRTASTLHGANSEAYVSHRRLRAGFQRPR